MLAFCDCMNACVVAVGIRFTMRRCMLSILLHPINQCERSINSVGIIAACPSSDNSGVASTIGSSIRQPLRIQTFHIEKDSLGAFSCPRLFTTSAACQNHAEKEKWVCTSSNTHEMMRKSMVAVVRWPSAEPYLYAYAFGLTSVFPARCKYSILRSISSACDALSRSLLLTTQSMRLLYKIEFGYT